MSKPTAFSLLFTLTARGYALVIAKPGSLALADAPPLAPRSPLHAYADAYATLRYGTGLGY